MATKRMFSNQVIGRDSFLDLEPMAQLLYFHCGMNTDDDGFISGVKRIARTIDATERDIRSLVDNGFLIEFPDSKVYVVTHHRVNNDLKNDRYHPTTYQKEFNCLEVTENKEYRPKQPVSNQDTTCNHSVSNQEVPCPEPVNELETEQSVTHPNVTHSNVTHSNGGKGSVEGETHASTPLDRDTVIQACISIGMTYEQANKEIDTHGLETVWNVYMKK